MDLMANGKSALLTFQRALQTTSHNIANAHTEGYTRQDISFQARMPAGPVGEYGGSGVEVQGIRRAYDDLLTNQMRRRSSDFAEADAFYGSAVNLDNYLGAQETGLAGSLQGFFDSLHDVANDPTSVPARQVLLGDAESLGSRFRELNAEFESTRQSTASQLGSDVADINSLASSIAALNQKIKEAGSLGDGQKPNDLLDQRDLLVTKLSEKVSVTASLQHDDTVNVYIGNGQSLVIGDHSERLILTSGRSEADELGIAYVSKDGPVDITAQVNGGTVGGTLNFRNEVLIPARNQLGRLAVAFASQFNAQHAAGVDLSGAAGGDFFSVGQPVVSDGANNSGTGTVNVGFGTESDMVASDYRLAYAGGSWTLTRLEDGSSVAMSGSGTAADPFVADGLSIEVGGVPAEGDVFRIEPYRGVADGFQVAVSNPREVAAAASGGVGDNGNALALASLQNSRILDGGTTTFDDAYGQLIANVGSKTYQAKIGREAQESMLDNVRSARDNVSGVNLDEEAANLLKFQQAYQAAAKMIAVADNMFQSLLSATGG